MNHEKAILWCDDHGFRFNQIAEMTTKEGGEARTIKMCKLCHNGRLVARQTAFEGGGMARDC